MQYFWLFSHLIALKVSRYQGRDKSLTAVRRKPLVGDRGYCWNSNTSGNSERKYIQQLWSAQHLECNLGTSKCRNFEMYLFKLLFFYQFGDLAAEKYIQLLWNVFGCFVSPNEVSGPVCSLVKSGQIDGRCLASNFPIWMLLFSTSLFFHNTSHAFVRVTSDNARFTHSFLCISLMIPIGLFCKICQNPVHRVIIWTLKFAES